jgi:hypothetical protein
MEKEEAFFFSNEKHSSTCNKFIKSQHEQEVIVLVHYHNSILEKRKLMSMS